MITLKNLTIKNFLSVGNVPQTINLNSNDLTLVLGQNSDLSEDSMSNRNGSGKSSIVNAISYVLFGESLSKIKMDNLINNINSKAMIVTIEFEKDGIEYKIERGRKPTFLKFYVGNTELENNEAQGDSKETQHAIEKVLGLSHDMFKHVMILSTYAKPFLELNSSEQREIIEQLLGITQLSEKAENLKEQTKLIKDEILREEYKIKSLVDTNTKINESLESLKQRQKTWIQTKQNELVRLTNEYDSLSNIDIASELNNHELKKEWDKNSKLLKDINNTLSSLTLSRTKEEKNVVLLSNQITELSNNKCYACEQKLHDDKHKKLLESKQTDLADSINNLNDIDNNIQTLNTEKEQLLSMFNPDASPKTIYPKESDAYTHKEKLNNILSQLVMKNDENDPYIDQIKEMEAVSLTEINYDALNALTTTKEHIDFLYKLLTNKDSFIRKKIIDQNLTFLNQRMNYYISNIGLPHNVIFQNDLSVEITHFGKNLDFHNLSRGEMTRLTISMSLAFRDVWESLYHPFNMLFVDEVMDNGTDGAGVDYIFNILKSFKTERNKSVWLISHKEELCLRADKILTAKKENRFTTYIFEGRAT